MGGWGSWALFGFSGLRFLCSVVGVAEVRLAPVCRVAWLMSAEVVSAGWGVTMPVGVTTWVVMAASISQRAVWAVAVAGRGAWGVPSKTTASVMVGMAVVWWPAEMSPLSGTIICGEQSVPSAVGILMSWMRSVSVAWCPWWRNLVGAVLCKVAKFITAITLGIWAVVAKMTCQSTNKTKHHTDCGGVSVAVNWCAALSFQAVWWLQPKFEGPFHIF